MSDHESKPSIIEIVAGIVGGLFAIALAAVIIFYIFIGIRSSVNSFHNLTQLRENIKYQFYAIDGIYMSRLEKADVLLDYFDSMSNKSISIDREKSAIKSVHQRLTDDAMRDQDALQSYATSQMEFNAQINRINSHLINSELFLGNNLFTNVSQFYISSNDSLFYAKKKYNSLVEQYNETVNRLPWGLLKFANNNFKEYCYFDVQSSK